MRFKKFIAAASILALAAAAAVPAFAGSEADRYIKCSLSRGGSVNLVNAERYMPEREAEPIFTQGEDGKYGLRIGDNIICENEWDDIQLNTSVGRLLASLGSENPKQSGAASLQGDFESDPETVSVKRDGMWGAVSKSTGELLIAPQYNEVCEINGIIRIMDFKGNYGYAAKDGQVMIEPKYDYVSAFSRSQLADFDSGYSCYTTVVGRDYGYTVLDLRSGDELIPLTTDTIKILSNDYFTVTNEDEFVSKLYGGEGDLLLELDSCAGIEMARDNRFLAAMLTFSESESGEKTIDGESDMLIDSKGDVILDGSEYYSLNYVGVGDSRPALVSADGADNSPVFFACARGSEMTETSDGTVLSGFDMFDIDGNFLTRVDAGDASVNCGTIRVCDNGKWGLIGTDGRKILPCEYDGINFPFIMRSGKIGVCDNAGNIIIEPTWETDSLSGCRVIELSGRVFFTFRAEDGGMYLADERGEVIAGPYTDISSKDGRLLVSLPVSCYKVLADVNEEPAPVPVVNMTDEAFSETTEYLKELDIIEDPDLETVTKGEFLKMLGKAAGQGDVVAADASDSDAPLTEGDALSITADYIRNGKSIAGSDKQIQKSEIEPYASCYMPTDFAADPDKVVEPVYAPGLVQAYELSMDSLRDEKTYSENPIENIIAYYFF